MNKQAFSFFSLIILGTMSLFANSGISIDEVSSKSELKKSYVQLENIQVQGTNLFAFVNNNWTQVNSIHSDINGLFIVNEWTCSGCSKETTSNVWTCDSCGRRR